MRQRAMKRPVKRAVKPAIAKGSIVDKIGILETLHARLFLTQWVIAHCKGLGESEIGLANNRRDERRLLEAIRFIEENARDAV